jgi:hypothetical protein
MGRNTRREPRAEVRAAAAQLNELFVALIDEGFTEEQATKMIGMMAAAQQTQQRPPD